MQIHCQLYTLSIDTFLFVIRSENSLQITLEPAFETREQVGRDNVDTEHIQQAKAKLAVLNDQQVDLSTSFNELLADIASGKRVMKLYRQMKLYNDPATNPVLYKRK